MAPYSGYEEDVQETGGMVDQISLVESCGVADLREIPRAALTLSDIFTISSSSKFRESSLTSSLQAFMLSHQDAKASS